MPNDFNDRKTRRSATQLAEYETKTSRKIPVVAPERVR